MDIAEETSSQRVDRIAASAAAREPKEMLTLECDDVRFLLTSLVRAGDQRVAGLREAAGLIRASRNREVTTRFLVGKKEHAARAMNSKLLSVVEALIDKYADDARDGKV